MVIFCWVGFVLVKRLIFVILGRFHECPVYEKLSNCSLIINVLYYSQYISMLIFFFLVNFLHFKYRIFLLPLSCLLYYYWYLASNNMPSTHDLQLYSMLQRQTGVPCAFNIGFSKVFQRLWRKIFNFHLSEFSHKDLS